MLIFSIDGSFSLTGIDSPPFLLLPSTLLFLSSNYISWQALLEQASSSSHHCLMGLSSSQQQPFSAFSFYCFSLLVLSPAWATFYKLSL